jgi:hypothetical protein
MPYVLLRQGKYDKMRSEGAVEIRSDERGKLIPTGMAGIRQQIKTVTYRLFFATDLSGYNPTTDLRR